MAEYDPSISGQGVAGPRLNFASLAGAAISLALVVGISVWGYRIVMRDVSGIPVVRALEGPIRIQPDDPGGVAAAHQGLSVNSIAADGIAEAPADRLVLAPAPEDLAEEDLDRVVLRVEAPEEELAVVSEDPGEETSAPTDDVAEALPETLPEDEAEAEAAILALADQIAAQATRPDTADLRAQSESASDEAAGQGVPRPKARPSGLTLARMSAPVDTMARTPRAPRDVAPETIEAGTPLVQLGAYPSDEIAREEWQRISGRFDELLGRKARVVQRTETGGRVFYRLRALGFDDVNDARRFCAALLAENADCIPVSAR